MVQVSIGCRVPESVKTELDEVAVLTGQSRGAIIVDALNDHLGRGKLKP
jgi:predicted transcriptional regulator